MERALYYESLSDQRVRCTLCPHSCFISEGLRGICHVRMNRDGILFTDVDGRYSVINMDPIEKKPLYHFFPGSSVLSLGTKGCNMRCKFCQNHEISQAIPGDYPYMRVFSDEGILEIARESNSCIGIAYTYNEPTVFFESMIVLARKAKLNDLKNVMVTNGYINPDPLDELLEYMDAFNIDLKAFRRGFYKKYTHSQLDPVLESLKTVRLSGRHLEITHLVIPGLNSKDKEFEELVTWVAGELGPDTVLHLSRFFPAYQLIIDPTPIDLLYRFYDIAKEHLNYVYLGNVNTRFGNDTSCHHCGQDLVRRFNYMVEVIGLEKGHCSACKKQVVIC
ncbi:AmmeMemoRadiSam system radical SAM enzyme [Ancylomarina sp.]|uniref:AmmeMemoRadiSam system radical SAM enzyme n=1 Tax=Ancylomarina sp. TaxID=1970196 RepID=UPI0035658A0F